MDCSTLYREGEAARGDPTYTPRAVLCDLSGALGALSQRGTLYAEPTAEGVPPNTGGGGHEVQRAPPVEESSFVAALQVEGEGEDAEAAATGGGAEAEPSPIETAAAALGAPGGVRYWTDYLKAHLHPRTACQLPGLWHGAARFAGWGDGAAQAARGDVRDDVLERVRCAAGGGLLGRPRRSSGVCVRVCGGRGCGKLGSGDPPSCARCLRRFFAEETDSLQGMQCWVEDLGGWGGLADSLLQARGGGGALMGAREAQTAPHLRLHLRLQEVRDDYRRPMLVFALRPPPSVPLQPAQQRQHALLEGLSLALLSQRADVYAVVAPPAPHALPLLHWTPGSWYQDSALCAAALDCATLPYRLSGLASAGAPLGAWVCVLGGGQ